jgi:hypothetical protein
MPVAAEEGYRNVHGDAINPGGYFIFAIIRIDGFPQPH